MLKKESERKRKSRREKKQSEWKRVKNEKDVFPKDAPHGLPPLRGTKYHINLTLGATLLNREAHRRNLEEEKEIQKQVAKLWKKVG
ncbi:hypothetical protein CR513_00506, partial [Mucuna pruriens]